MRRVHRERAPRPSGWHDQVRRALPDYEEFLRQAARFEKLVLTGKTRRKGFSGYAPGGLVANKFPAIWGKHKEVIAAMSHRKCVYCEAPINAPRAANVDHFKPKALFPSLAYEWTNYFLGCTGCNGAKSNKWPARGGYIRPDRSDPSRHFIFAEDGTVKPAKPGGAGELTLDDLDLKRKWLSDERKFHIQEMLRSLKDAEGFHRKGHKDVAKTLGGTLLRNVTDPGRAYSVALTQCFWRAWRSACSGVKV
jgi:uncharacterized protein (TIGR02646 family)